MKREVSNFGSGMASGMASFGRAIIICVLIVTGMGIATGMMLYRTIFVPACLPPSTNSGSPVRMDPLYSPAPVKLKRAIPQDENAMPSDGGEIPVPRPSGQEAPLQSSEMPSDGGEIPILPLRLINNNQEGACQCERIR